MAMARTSSCRRARLTTAQERHLRAALFCATAAVLALGTLSPAFLCPLATRARTGARWSHRSTGRLPRRAFPWESMGDGLFGGKKVEVPATTREVIEALQAAMKGVLKGGKTRVDIELPTGLRLGGIEGTVDPLVMLRGDIPQERVARGDRDLARFMAILLSNMGDRLCIVFRNGALAKDAKQVFQASKNGGRLMSFGGGGGKRSAFGGGSSTENLRRAITEASCEFLVMVAPRTRQLPAVAELCEEFGGKVRLVLLNARLRGKSHEGDKLRSTLAAEFDPIFNVQLFDCPGGEGMLFRALLEDGSTTPWVVARKELEASEDGQEEKFTAQVISQSEKEPLISEVEATLRAGR